MTHRDRSERTTRLPYTSLRNSRDFRRVLNDGIRRREGGITVVSAPGTSGPPRLGLVVSRSCGSAVRRNRIKRRLRSAAHRIGLLPGFDHVIIATSEVADVPFDRLSDWMRRALPESADV
ncbi:MAG: ribonuclease P protein component [Acidimicrobiia bacterium]